MNRRHRSKSRSISSSRARRRRDNRRGIFREQAGEAVGSRPAPWAVVVGWHGPCHGSDSSSEAEAAALGIEACDGCPEGGSRRSLDLAMGWMEIVVHQNAMAMVLSVTCRRLPLWRQEAGGVGVTRSGAQCQAVLGRAVRADAGARQCLADLRPPVRVLPRLRMSLEGRIEILERAAPTKAFEHGGHRLTARTWRTAHSFTR